MDNEFDKGINFFDRLYKVSVMLALAVALGLTIVGLRQIFVISNKLDERSQETLMSINCVVSLFTHTGTTRSQLAIQQSINQCTVVKK